VEKMRSNYREVLQLTYLKDQQKRTKTLCYDSGRRLTFEYEPDGVALFPTFLTQLKLLYGEKKRFQGWPVRPEVDKNFTRT